MKWEKKNGKVHIAAFMKVVAGALCIILMVQIGCNMVLAERVRKNTREQMEGVLNYFVDETNSRLNGIYERLKELVMLNSGLRVIGSLNQEMDVLNTRKSIVSDLTDIQDLYGNEFGVFVYDREAQHFYHGRQTDWDLKSYYELSEKLMEHLLAVQEEKEPQGRNWSTFESGGENYIYGYEAYLGYYACAMISEQDFLKPQRYMQTGQEALVQLLGKDGNPGQEQLKRLKEDRYLVQVLELGQADFDILIGARNSEEIQSLMLLQMVIWMAAVLMSALTLGTILMVKRRVIAPLEYFAGNLIHYQESGEDSYFEDSRIYELEKANELFKRNLESMKELKIRMYEETLKKQRLEMEYTKLQINPHFYINCMNQIYNMACLEDYENIMTMSSNISDYFRYIFQKKSDYVELSQELNHIRTYLNMCRFRYGRNFTYDVTLTQDVSDVKIPPLLLHTFVENALKYGMNRESGYYVGVRVERFPVDGADLVTIEISDNGDGFPAEILDKLQRHNLDIAPDGTKVGITNAVYRLDYLYHGAARLNFFNRDGSGAVIKLCIPVDGSEEGGKPDEYSAGG